MKRLLVIVCAMITFASVSADAQDVREAARRAEIDRVAAVDRARLVEEAILADRETLLPEIERLEAEERRLESRLGELEARTAALEKRRERLADRWAGEELQYKEISGNVRLAARDLSALLEQSPLTSLRPQRLAPLRQILRQGYFPDIDDISGMAAALLDEMKLGGQVGFSEGTFVGRHGDDLWCWWS